MISEVPLTSEEDDEKPIIVTHKRLEASAVKPVTS
jgi:hypothetical protein